VHAITSPRYARVQHDELAGRVLDLMAQHPAWHLPLGYKDGECGAERVPSGAYLGDGDMFPYLVDGNRDLDDPTDHTHAGLFPIITRPILRLASALSRLSASLRPRGAGLTALTGPSVEPCVGSHVMVGQS
jgi:hypothetical protein